MVRPKYAEDIVVGIISDKSFGWFILEKELCFLDLNKLSEAWRKRGYDEPDSDSERFGIRVVDEHTQYAFLQKIEDFKVTTTELRKMLMAETDSLERAAFRASLLIDFDQKRLLSIYYEPESFEAYVPEGWTGEYEDFYSEIPVQEKYWFDENGNDLLFGED